MQPSIKTRSSQSFGKEVVEVFSEDLHVGVYHQFDNLQSWFLWMLFLCKTMSAFLSSLCTQHWSCHFGMIASLQEIQATSYNITPLPGFEKNRMVLWCRGLVLSSLSRLVVFHQPQNRKLCAGPSNCLNLFHKNRGENKKYVELQPPPSFPGARDLLVQTACQYSQASSLTVAAA